MADATDKDIRSAIKDVIKALYPDAVVFQWNALSHNLGEWPGMFRTETGTHGWIIKRGGVSGGWKNGQRDRKTFVYDIWGFYGYSSGKESENSDDDFGAILDAIYEALKEKPTLDLEGLDPHGLLQVAANTTIDTGEETLHFAQCRLEVKLCC